MLISRQIESSDASLWRTGVAAVQEHLDEKENKCLMANWSPCSLESALQAGHGFQEERTFKQQNTGETDKQMTAGHKERRLDTLAAPVKQRTVKHSWHD